MGRVPDIQLFNSHPHEEDDLFENEISNFLHFFNSHPHEEDDDIAFSFCFHFTFSTHILTRRMTSINFGSRGRFAFFNSHPHEEDDDYKSGGYAAAGFFNSHPHEEDDSNFKQNLFI